MKQFFTHLQALAHRLRKYISPVFLALFAVSFTLWYISKLSYTYTTDFDVEVEIDGRKIIVPCVVEGKGSTLFGYVLYNSRSVSLSPDELKYDILPVKNDNDSIVGRKMSITTSSMQDALSVRFSDLKILSVGTVPDVNL